MIPTGQRRRVWQSALLPQDAAPALPYNERPAAQCLESVNQDRPLLEIRGLRNRDLGPVDLVVAAGECVCLFGPSGAGKSVLLRSLADLEPHAGEVQLEGRPCRDFRPAQWRRKVGLLPAESAWWADTVGEHFDETDSEGLAALGFGPEVMGWQVGRLSTGERQRLALLRLLANRPRVLLLDEPTGALDPDGVNRVEAMVGRYRKEMAAAVIWVSHDPAQGRRVAERCCRIVDGRLEEARP